MVRFIYKVIFCYLVMSLEKIRKLNLLPFILILNGSSCMGKTSIAKIIHSKYKNVFFPRGDKIKWFISDYNRLIHKPAVVNMVDSLIVSAIKEGFSIVHDWSITDKQRRKYRLLSKKLGLIFLEVNLETDFEIISKRFTERMDAAKKGAKISLLDSVLMKKYYEGYLELRNKKLISFDSGKLTPEEIAKKIVSLIKNF